MGGIDELDSVLSGDTHQFGYCPCLSKVILHRREAIHCGNRFVIVLIGDNEAELGLLFEPLRWQVVHRVADFCFDFAHPLGLGLKKVEQ